MLDYSEYACPHCGYRLLIYHQYIADACCEGCGRWGQDDD